MSPLAVRRYRADRLLREEFQSLRERVLRTVGARLRSAGMALDGSDLEACYAIAWQGLHAKVLEGEAIESPFGWLVLVTFRRAVEECRVRRAAVSSPDELERRQSSTGGDLAGALDDRIRLAQLFEGLRAHLNDRERQAVTLCYLHGLSRAEAAARMGISDGRMRKLMEGRGASDPGVCGKLGVLAETIEAGRWCDSQGSLMRALAYGVLDPAGERHRMATAHCDGCPACRAYVLSLRGLAAALPPVLLPWGPLAAAIGGGRGVAHISAAARQGAHASSAGSGAAYASGAAGASGGGWLLTGGGLSAKLAVGCLIALGVGGGCVALQAGTHRSHHDHAHRSHVTAARLAGASVAADVRVTPKSGEQPGSSAGAPAGASTSSSAAKARREFGPEQALSGGQNATAASAQASTSESRRSSAHTARYATAGGSAAATASTATAGSQARAAEREFAPG
jgi:DNA-directed RNA polymerase specialized sigma24 family protein